MRRTSDLIKRASANGRKRAQASNRVQANNRLAAALDICTPEDSTIFEIATRNKTTGQMHYIEIVHEAYGGANRYAVYLDGERWRNGWSRTRFANWMFQQIESVRREWG